MNRRSNCRRASASRNDDTTVASRKILDGQDMINGDFSPDPAILKQVVTRQKEIADAMRSILTHMVKAEGYQEAVNLLYEIQKTQQDVYDRTIKEKQERIKGIIEGRSGTEEKPKE